MKLASNSIDQLYKFTRAHFVEWYDLQTELVDHLSNDIEHLLEKDPKLTFDQARIKAFKKFGILGFSEIIEQKRNALLKNYWKLVWQIFKDFFTLPKVILTFFTIIIVYVLFKEIIFKEYLLFIFLGVIYFVIFRFLYVNHQKNKIKFHHTQKKWLIQENIETMGGFISLLGLPFIILSSIIDKLNWSELITLITSVILVVTALLVYILTQVIPIKLEEQVCKPYPNYKLYKKA